MATPMMTDLLAVLRAAERGVWFTPVTEGVTLLAQALPPRVDAGAAKFREWAPFADDLVGQIAVGRVLLGEPPDLGSELVRAVLLDKVEPRLGVLMGGRLPEIQRFERHDPWAMAEAFALVADGRPTRLGVMARTLHERDRVELLLAIGATLASGYADRWRLSREALGTALDAVVHLFDEYGRVDANGWWVAASLGGLSAHTDSLDEASRTHLHAVQRERIAEIVSGTSPMLAVVRAALDDRRAAVLGIQPSASDALGPFVHGMRNKLRALDAAVRRLRESSDAGVVGPHADDLGARVAALDEVLDRLGTPLAAATQARLDLRGVALAAIRALERENGIHVSLLVEGDVPLVTADPERLQEVLEELLRNARDAGATRATLRLVPRAGGGATITVDNDGPPPAEPTRLFEDGYSTKATGRGRGLALARQALLRFGATLALGTAPDGMGVRFVVSLPGER